ncbi:Non-canonical poly(A) RNA polymerase protein Trf4-1 isoform A [Senna tora]|uniref:Non-canonical poly(A) RNA polymerase protein Trf4-1 isoform A n=1 Tax=Senna tora TaxID=362788 RepID=A0A834TN45_9FABA|nr:Non-canonical poly(A) RNA polymerase protein Trf4-1 isoform A [Senna tora]
MAHHQLIDSLTSHISLYHSHSLPRSTSTSNSNSNPRSAILRWFSSLSLHQRLAHLTIVDSKFVQVLIQMLGKVRAQGHGFFIILPDLPSRDPPYLPSLCYKKSRGLLSRVAESNESDRLVFESVRLFGSREGENFQGCSCSVKSLDTVTVTEEFVEKVDRLVEAMDEISNGGFLRGENNDLGGDWVELDWLKSKGYYSIEAFVANRLEVSMRLAWLNCNNGRKRGVKLKEKLNEAGVAANVYRRKRGCLDWWGNLDTTSRKKILTTIMGKAAKHLIHEVLKVANSAPEDEIWLYSAGVDQLPRYKYNHTVSAQRTYQTLLDVEFGTANIPVSFCRKSAALARAFNSLFVLQDVNMKIASCHDAEYAMENLFFSSLGSVSTISDCILRIVRGFLMVISLDCTKLELLTEELDKSSTGKPKEKIGSSNRKKKGQNRNTKRSKSNPVSKPCVDGISHVNPMKDLNTAVDNRKKTDTVESRETPDVPLGKDMSSGSTSSTLRMDHRQGLDAGKLQTPPRRSRKEKNKIKKSLVDHEVGDSKKFVMDATSATVISESKVVQSNRLSDNSTIQSVKNDNVIGNDIFSSNSSLCCSLNGSTREGNSTKKGQGDNIDDSNKSCSSLGSQCYPLPNEKTSSSQLDNSTCDVDCNITQPVPALKLGSLFSKEDSKPLNSVCVTESYEKSAFLDKPIREHHVKEFGILKDRDRGCVFESRTSSLSKCSPYEWPRVPSIYYPSINSHLPPATDRLHLDVGHHWHNHFCHSFVPTLHQARKTPIEGGCNRILSCPIPMSLDWPPVFRGGMAPSSTCNYDSGFMSRRQSTFSKGLAAHNVQVNATSLDDEGKYSGDLLDLPDLISTQDPSDEFDNHWVSEEEYEVHAVSGIDYNQYFGGGIMYWNPSDYPGSGFSRPPSLSSDDSSWAWREADLNRAVDDMVAFSSSYSTNGLTSPTAASFCSPFDTVGTGPQTVGYVMSGNEVTGKVLHSSSVTDVAVDDDSSGPLGNNVPGDVEGKTGDSHPYPILRPIIIPNMSRERSRSDFKRSFDHKSPRVPPTRREQPRIKRPPSPVVLSVPRAPRPPPPSPVSDSRKQRGFPTVRSGSSSPRHWGMRGWLHDGSNLEEACLRMDGAEVVWPSWRTNNLAVRPMIQPLPAALLQDRLLAISQIARDQEHPDVAFPLQPPELQGCPARSVALSLMHGLLHDEIDSFCKQVAAENMARKPYINWAVKRVTRSLQVLWPRSRTNIFGSNATGMSLPTSDVDLVVCLPPVRNLEPIKEAGILEGRNGIKETCLQHAARYLANQDWVKNDSLKTVENTAIPIIMLVVKVPDDVPTTSASVIQSPKEEPPRTVDEHDSKLVRLDISFKTPSHTGLQTTELVKQLTEQFPAATPLALVLKQFLADRSLDQSYSGGLSSYCLVLLIIRFLQHEHHLGRPINQNYGNLLMDFVYFFGNVFDPRQMRISVQGSGVYIKRERGCSIDPIHIDDPLFPTNNVGRNCFRIHQCIKAFSEAYSILEDELSFLNSDGDSCSRPSYRLLPKIIPSFDVS